MKPTRRGLFGMVAGAIAAKALPEAPIRQEMGHWGGIEAAYYPTIHTPIPGKTTLEKILALKRAS